LLNWNDLKLLQSIQTWLEEDIGSGDVTTSATVPREHCSIGIIHVKEDGIIAGLPFVQTLYAQLNAKLQFSAKAEEGSHVTKGTVVATIEGLTHDILLGERVSLNVLQRLSGIATRTKQYVDAAENPNVRIVDTRKTTPGLRNLEKYAVRVGGGYNHRFGLYDAVLIKDNHIKASGSVVNAIRQARAQIPHTMKIEVEIENKIQLEQAVDEAADIIMLDNMSPTEMKTAVAYIKKQNSRILIEASGSVTLDKLKEIAQTGVDLISIGKLTHSITSLDISLDLQEQKEAAF
jgi:nicotinate-nucleotide pyrophosphorylase (carboxylating)